jgi:hypothetical protein
VKTVRTLKRIAVVGLLAVILSVGTSRLAALLSGNAFNAVGEREWFEWAWRGGVAQPLGEVEHLRKGEVVDIAISDAVVDGRWWGAMVRYYLPLQRPGRIVPGATSTGSNTLLILRGRKVEVVRAR